MVFFLNHRFSSYGQYIIMLTTMFATLFKVGTLEKKDEIMLHVYVIASFSIV